MNFEANTNWIWCRHWSAEEDSHARLVYFRNVFDVPEVPASYRIRITADSRYKLYINGRFVQEGPPKGDHMDWFVDEAELAPFLTPGANAAAVEVLRYPEARNRRNQSLYRSAYPCLYVEDLATGQLDGDGSWKYRKAKNIRITGEPTNPAPLHITEALQGDPGVVGWFTPEYRGSGWQSAQPYKIIEINRAEAPFHLRPRDIPPQVHRERRFTGITCVRQCDHQRKSDVKRSWEKLLAEDAPLTIPPYTTQIVEIDAGEEMCGYLQFAFYGGAGGNMRWLCSESYVYPAPSRFPTSEGIKGDRTDHVRGHLVGAENSYLIVGCGTEDLPETYEPYWFRTFRYLQIIISTGAEALVLPSLTYRETGYPLEVKTKVTASDPTFPGIWDISERTLRRCMHETYMDCPYYEQLPYAMDSRTEILCTYTTAADDRLARRCMDDFRRSQRPDGMINSCAPTITANVIPGFSVYYILMVHDHMMYFGDRELVEEHLPAIDRILHFFDSHRTEKGLVGSVGGPLFEDTYWSFIDWCRQWNDTAGVPSACRKGDGSITMESLLYLYGLQKAAELARYVNRAEQAEEYLRRAEDLKTAILRECLGTALGDAGSGGAAPSAEPGCNAGSEEAAFLIQDGPGVDQYSVHCQVFAVLTGLVSPAQGKAMLTATLGRPELPQCSVAMSFYLFRALEAVDWYEKADDIWDIWRRMLKNNLTTCVENDTDERSDCHAWGSLILYELPAVTLGVRPAAPGFAEIAVRPVMGHLSHASGDVITPRGMVHVEWKKAKDGTCRGIYRIGDSADTAFGPI